MASPILKSLLNDLSSQPPIGDAAAHQTNKDFGALFRAPNGNRGFGTLNIDGTEFKLIGEFNDTEQRIRGKAKSGERALDFDLRHSNVNGKRPDWSGKLDDRNGSLLKLAAWSRESKSKRAYLRLKVDRK